MMIPSDRSHLFVAAVSHPGMSGKNNEDNYAVSAHFMDQTRQTPSLLAIVADGIGGHKAGEVASEIATETISKYIGESEAEFPPEILEKAIIKASFSIFEQNDANGDQAGMGSTCVCVWIIKDQLYTAYVGDSRIYLIRDGKIQRLTVDHSWVQEAMEHGIITPDQAKNHPRAHVIRRYLGSSKPAEPDFRLQLSPEETEEQSVANQGTRLIPGDQLVLCSDGLTDLVTDEEILKFVQMGDLEKSVQDLVDLANERGGHDNITIVALKVPPLPDEVPQPVENIKKPVKKRSPIFLALAILVVIVAALGTILYLYVTRAAPSPQPTLTPTVLELTETTALPPTLELTTTSTATPAETPIKLTYTPWPTNTIEP